MPKSLLVQKLSISGVKDTAKTNKDLGMSFYIQVERIWFHFPMVALIEPCKNYFQKYKKKRYLLNFFLYFYNILENNFT